MQNSIYKIKYLLFLSWDWEAWCLTQSGEVIHPPPERDTASNKGRKCFHCLGAPNTLIRPWLCGDSFPASQEFLPVLWGPKLISLCTRSCNLFLVFTISLQSTISQPISRPVLILPCHLHLCLPSVLFFTSGFPTVRL